EALVEAAERPADWMMAGIVGAAGLEPTLAAVRCGRIVAFANKEVLVSAGTLFMREIAMHGATLLPVDSEHNAIWQCFDFDRIDTIEKITLTCSGGPFRERSYDEMRDMSPAEAVAHPTWRMGAKISVDSATLMNKGLELIEAHHLFRLAPDRIDIVVHPQSVIHGLVSYRDGSVLAHLGSPDMRTPIAYALGWPDRTAAPCKRLDLAEIGRLTFEAPDERRFPALRLASEALAAGGCSATILNAANETAVHAFLGGEIGFLDIAATVERTLAAVPARDLDSLDDVYEVDRLARETAARLAVRRANHPVGETTGRT
ncbi:MAG TPA: 1-deoxy-D-xylulose-5-phosphate reductoisomerase, partial [Stellaceae bacterium]|nr:1-deoxy-D-xylulose-5-phosphate reductoisomerase [Stellaceae bacterium]